MEKVVNDGKVFRIERINDFVIEVSFQEYDSNHELEEYANFDCFVKLHNSNTWFRSPRINNTFMICLTLCDGKIEYQNQEYYIQGGLFT
jgi:hypothetical protein